jgi:hypothetical protein
MKKRVNVLVDEALLLKIQELENYIEFLKQRKAVQRLTIKQVIKLEKSVREETRKAISNHIDKLIEERDTARITNEIYNKSSFDLNEDFIDALKELKKKIKGGEDERKKRN